MPTSVAIPGTNITVLWPQRSSVSGLWEALVASTTSPSAAGSRLAEPTRLGQPISPIAGTDYGADAKRNFVEGCTTSNTIQDGKVVSSTIAPKSDCECVYEKIHKTYRLSWDDLVAYEEQVADAKAGEAPEPPEKLKKAVADCLGTATGPTAPTTTTTEPS